MTLEFCHQYRPCWLYCITHTRSGNQYIGISTDPNRRWKDHKQHCKKQNTRFYNALRKHGPEQFVFQILEQLDSVEEAKIREIMEISGREPEYNSTAGGDGMWNPPEHVRKRMSDSMKTSEKAIAHRARLWDIRRTNTSQEEWSRIMSEAQANMSPEAKAQKSRKLSEAQAARTPEQEVERQRKRAETVAARSPEEKFLVSCNLSAGIKARELTEDQKNLILAGATRGGHISGQREKQRLANMSEEDKKVRMENIVAGIKRAASSRTQAEKDEITRKRLESRARNKAALEQSGEVG